MIFLVYLAFRDCTLGFKNKDLVDYPCRCCVCQSLSLKGFLEWGEGHRAELFGGRLSFRIQIEKLSVRREPEEEAYGVTAPTLEALDCLPSVWEEPHAKRRGQWRHFFRISPPSFSPHLSTPSPDPPFALPGRLASNASTAATWIYSGLWLLTLLHLSTHFHLGLIFQGFVEISHLLVILTSLPTPFIIMGLFTFVFL